MNVTLFFHLAVRFSRSRSLHLIYVFLLYIKAGDTSSGSALAQNDAAKTDKNEDLTKEKASRKSKKKEKENVEKASVKPRKEKRLLVLPLAASVVAVLLLVLLGAFYVVLIFSVN